MTAPSKTKEGRKAYYAANAESIQKMMFKSKLKTRFNLTVDQYESMAIEGCGICGIMEEDLGRRLAVDHCHETGRVRGVLCHACNTALGKLGDNEEGVLRALDYLRRVKS